MASTHALLTTACPTANGPDRQADRGRPGLEEGNHARLPSPSERRSA
jgi:hypothetical protein